MPARFSLRRTLSAYARRFGLVLSVFASVLSQSEAGPPEARVLMLVSSGHSAYEEASRTAQQALQEAVRGVELRVLGVEDEAATPVAPDGDPSPFPPAVVVAIGSRAARAAQRVAPGAPLVYGMVLDPLALGAARNATGVSMDVPPEVQLGLIRQLVPQARRIGILYDPLQSGSAVPAATAAARSLGLVIVPRPVRGESEVLEAARLLAPAADVIWVFADPTVLTSATSRALILLCLRAHRPLFAPSESFVQTGALAAVRADAREVGRRTGEVASLLLRGTPLSTMRPEPPPRYSIYLNRAVADHLGVSIPEELAARAEAIYPRP